MRPCTTICTEVHLQSTTLAIAAAIAIMLPGFVMAEEPADPGRQHVVEILLACLRIRGIIIGLAQNKYLGALSNGFDTAATGMGNEAQA